MLDVFVHRSQAIRFEQGDQVVHKVAGSDLGEEVGAAILDTGVGQLERGNLHVGILVAYSLLQRPHGIFRRHRFTPDQVGDLQAGCDVFQARRSGPLDLLVEDRVPRREPACHAVLLNTSADGRMQVLRKDSTYSLGSGTRQDESKYV